MLLRHARGATSLQRCVVMGIVNRTPDSFYDGGRMDLESAVEHALHLIDEGADLLDVGGVKAGPGEVVTQEEETRRVVPLVAALAERTQVPISVETARPAVARAVLASGAAIINDVSGLSDPETLEVVAGSGAGLVLVHHGGQLRSRPRHPRYDDVVADVIRTWDELARTAVASGIGRDRLLADAALDFGKTTFHSLELVRRLPEQVAFGLPVLVAASRKDVVGETLGLASAERLEGSLALAAVAAFLGAHVVRAHDVRATVRAVRMASAAAGRERPAEPLRGLWE